MRELTQQEHEAVTGGAPSNGSFLGNFFGVIGWSLTSNGGPLVKPLGDAFGFLGNFFAKLGL